MTRIFRTVLLTLLAALNGGAADWIRPGLNTNQPVWGLRGGLLWAIHPGGFRPGEPRGLIRLGYPILPGGRYDLINFIAIEPVVTARKGFSELEHSRLDDTAGKRIQAGDGATTNRADGRFPPGELKTLENGTEELVVTLRVEQFDNGAHVRLVARQRGDRPDELDFAIYAEPRGAPMESCTLTATMGNMARTRLLWLADGVLSSLNLYPDYRESGFAPHTFRPLPRLHRTPGGDVLVAITTDEVDPASVYPFRNSRFWYYGGGKVTQYWRKPAGTFGNDLQAAVNARYTYWMSRRPIPGGIAFENFELREPFHDGQRFVFGITRKTPQELGFKAPSLQPAAARAGD